MNRTILRSFILRASFATLILLIFGVWGTVYFMQRDFEKTLGRHLEEQLGSLKEEYSYSLKQHYQEKSELMRHNAQTLMNKMEFIHLEIYDENHEELFNLSPQTQKAKILDDVIQQNHDRVLLHTFPKDARPVYNFFSLQEHLFIQVFFPLAVNNHKIGYIEGVLLINPLSVKQFKNSLVMTVAAICISTLLLSLIIFPLIVLAYRQLSQKHSALINSNIQTIRSLGNAIAQRDSDTDEHNYRVTLYSIALAERIHLPRETIQKLIKGAFLHDVGKIGIADAILLKPGKLTDEEFNRMQEHVTKGIEIVHGIEWLDEAKEVILYHHEKFDGSGYAHGLKGEEIPLAARIFAVVDVFDALTSKRPYKEPYPLEKAVAILREGSGKHFDPMIVEEFLMLISLSYETMLLMDSTHFKAKLYEKIAFYFDET